MAMKYFEEVLNITHQEKANHDHSEMSLHAC